MKIDWKRKLTSRKFWAAVAGFTSMLLIYFGKDAGQAEQTVALIMAGASVIAYIIGEGLADSAGDSFTTNYNSPHVFDAGKENTPVEAGETEA